MLFSSAEKERLGPRFPTALSCLEYVVYEIQDRQNETRNYKEIERFDDFAIGRVVFRFACHSGTKHAENTGPHDSAIGLRIAPRYFWTFSHGIYYFATKELNCIVYM